jgi:hypothetical protein
MPLPPSPSLGFNSISIFDFLEAQQIVYREKLLVDFVQVKINGTNNGKSKSEQKLTPKINSQHL